MRVEYDHYSKMCKSNKIPPIAQKDIPSYTEQLDTRIKEIEQVQHSMINTREEIANMAFQVLFKSVSNLS